MMRIFFFRSVFDLTGAPEPAPSVRSALSRIQRATNPSLGPRLAGLATLNERTHQRIKALAASSDFEKYLAEEHKNLAAVRIQEIFTNRRFTQFSAEDAFEQMTGHGSETVGAFDDFSLDAQIAEHILERFIEPLRGRTHFPTSLLDSYEKELLSRSAEA